MTGFAFTFLRNRSMNNARWFYGIKKNLEGDLYLTENRLHRNKMGCAVDNHNYLRHICTKGFLDLNCN